MPISAWFSRSQRYAWPIVLRSDKPSRATASMTTRRSRPTARRVFELFSAAQRHVLTKEAEVIQVFSLYCEVQYEGTTHLCVVRKTLTKVSDTPVIVGDLVRFRLMDITTADASQSTGAPQAVVEQVLPRKTILTRADSFKGIVQHPIVANAEQMLVVASLHSPEVKWGLVDRMLVAAQSGGLRPVVCLNKVDLVERDPQPEDEDYAFAQAALAHYQSLGVATLQRGHWVMFIIGIFFPLFWIIGALVPPTRDARAA